MNHQRQNKARVLLILALVGFTALSIIFTNSYSDMTLFLKAKSSDSNELKQDSVQATKDLDDKLNALMGSCESTNPEDNSHDYNIQGPAEAKDPDTDQAVTSSSPKGTESEEGGQQVYSKELEQHYLTLENEKEIFTSKLEVIVQSAKNEYATLPKEQQTTDRKIKIVMSKMGELQDLENSCDAKVETEVSEIQDILQKSGEDTSLANDILKSYENLKAAKKTEYINELYS